MSNIYAKPNADLTVKTNKDSEVTQAMIDGVYKGKGWAKFMSILMFIFAFSIGLFIIFFLFRANVPNFTRRIPFAGLIFVAVFALFFISILFRLGQLFSNYNTSLKSLKESSSIEDLDNCFSNFAKIHKMVVIMFIPLICIVILTAIM